MTKSIQLNDRTLEVLRCRAPASSKLSVRITVQ